MAVRPLVCVSCGVPLNVSVSTSAFVCDCVGGVAVFPRTFAAFKAPKRDVAGPIVTGEQGDW